MGAGIAAILCGGGWAVQVIEPARETAANLPERVAGCLAELAAKGSAPDVIAAAQDVDWEGVDLVIECLPEDLAIKQRFFAELEGLAPARTILASNSSSFPISDIAVGRSTPWRMAGLHFFMPAHLVPLVEVISGEATAPETATTLCEWMTALGKRPVHVRKDIPGFLANRIQHALMREALSLVERGIASPEDIDAAVQYGFGMRFLGAGPCLQKDLAGIDIHHAAASTIYPDLCNATAPGTALSDRVAQGDLGVKTGRGFYDWDEAGIAREQARYKAALSKALAAMAGDSGRVRAPPQ